MSGSSTNQATITAIATCGNKTGSGSYIISLTRTNSTSSSVRVNVVDSSSTVLAYTTVSYPSSNIHHADVIRKGKNDVEFVQVGADNYIAVVPVSVKAYSSSTATTAFWSGDTTVDITDAIELYFNAVDIQSVEALTTTSSTYNTGVTQRVGLGLSQLYASGSIYYGRIKVTLENGNVENIRVSTPRVNSVVLGEYSASERYSAALSYYKWSGNRGYVKAVAKSSSNVVLEADLDVTSLVQAAQQSGGGASTPITLRCTNKSTGSGIATTWTFQITSTTDYWFTAGNSYTFYY